MKTRASRFAILLGAAAMAAACAPGTLPDGSETATTGAEAAPRPASASDVAGDWDVVSFDGYTVPFRSRGTERAAFANFTDGGVGLHLECNWSGVPGRMRGDVFKPSGEGPWPQTLAGCEADKAERDDAYFAFFARSPKGEVLPGDRLRFTAGDTVLLLERPEQRRLGFVPELAGIEGQWRMVGLTMFAPQGGMSGMGLTEVPGRVVIDGGRIGYNRCPQYDAEVTYTQDGVFRRTGGAAVPDEPAGCEELAERSWNKVPPELWDILEMLHDNPRAERLAEGDLLLTTDSFGLHLTQQPCVQLNQSDDHSRTWEEDCASPE
ncbi:hypothetical protein [Paraurantiacibacter namhicola]|uniref:META domain protein n=1 Tax=Paraurantiacibacter namhicola TaxID=645517 RepID=A0A1C7D6L3_9SPHN|nr:hypothetical protein [Paraurantiacibacter namhicola]ANU07126.1 hypothetical protein A6F65_00808 [Paraurantiacibacter namhicola]